MTLKFIIYALVEATILNKKHTFEAINADKLFMLRCIELAQLSLGSVAPNPLVGSVLVNRGKIIGEGFHQKFGEAHAEVNAINSVKEKSFLSRATLYVNLEPCSHFGKTPSAGIPRQYFLTLFIDDLLDKSDIWGVL